MWNLKPLSTPVYSVLLYVSLFILFAVSSEAVGNSSTARLYIVGNNTATPNVFQIIGAANYTFTGLAPGGLKHINFTVRVGNGTLPAALYNFSLVSGNLSYKPNQSNLVTIEVFKKDKGIIPKVPTEGEPFHLNMTNGEHENPFKPNATNSTAPGQVLRLVWRVQARGPPGYNWSFYLRSGPDNGTYYNQSNVVLHDIVNTLASTLPDVNPSFTNFTLNDTNAKFNDTIKWSAFLFDDTGSGNFTCGYNNGTLWTNQTLGSWTNATTVNCVQRITSTRNTNFSVRIYFNDNNGNGNKTNELSFLVADTVQIWTSNISNKTINENSGLQFYDDITGFCTDVDGDSITLSLQQETTSEVDITFFSGNETIYVTPATNFTGKSSPIMGCTANSILVNTSFTVLVTDQNNPGHYAINSTSQNLTYGQRMSFNVTWRDTHPFNSSASFGFRSNYTGTWKEYPMFGIGSDTSTTISGISYYFHDVMFNTSGTDISAGIFYFNFTANDSSGNRNFTMPVNTVTIIQAVPTVSLYVNGSQSDITIRSDETLSLNATVRYINNQQQSHTLKIWTNFTTAQLSLFGASTGFSFINVTGLSGLEGVYRVFANVTDDGNYTEGSDGIYFVTILDRIPPSFSGQIMSPIKRYEISTFNITISDDVRLLPNGQYIFGLNIGNASGFVNSTVVNFTSENQFISILRNISSPNGTLIQFQFYARDNAGNWNKSGVSSLRVNKTDYYIRESVPNINHTHIINLSLQINVTDPDDEPVVWSSIVVGNNSNLRTVNVTLNASGYLFYNPNITDNGTYLITVTITNGPQTNTSVFNYSVHNSKPTFNQTLPSFSIFYGDTLTIQLNTTDPERDLIYYGINDTRSGNMTINTSGYISYTPNSTDNGTIRFRIFINDSWDVNTQDFNVVVTGTGHTASFSTNISTVMFVPNATAYNWTSKTLYQENISAQNQTTWRSVINVSNINNFRLLVKAKTNFTDTRYSVRCGVVPLNITNSSVLNSITYTNLVILQPKNTTGVWCWGSYLYANATLKWRLTIDGNGVS